MPTSALSTSDMQRLLLSRLQQLQRVSAAGVAANATGSSKQGKQQVRQRTRQLEDTLFAPTDDATDNAKKTPAPARKEQQDTTSSSSGEGADSTPSGGASGCRGCCNAAGKAPSPEVTLAVLPVFVYALYARQDPVPLQLQVMLTVRADSLEEEGGKSTAESSSSGCCAPTSVRASTVLRLLRTFRVAVLCDAVRRASKSLQRAFLFFGGQPLSSIGDDKRTLADALPTVLRRYEASVAASALSSPDSHVSLPLRALPSLFLSAVPMTDSQAECTCEGCRRKHEQSAGRLARAHNKRVFQLQTAQQQKMSMQKKKEVADSTNAAGDGGCAECEAESAASACSEDALPPLACGDDDCVECADGDSATVESACCPPAADAPCCPMDVASIGASGEECGSGCCTPVSQPCPEEGCPLELTVSSCSSGTEACCSTSVSSPCAAPDCCVAPSDCCPPNAGLRCNDEQSCAQVCNDEGCPLHPPPCRLCAVGTAPHQPPPLLLPKSSCSRHSRKSAVAAAGSSCFSRACSVHPQSNRFDGGRCNAMGKHAEPTAVMRAFRHASASCMTCLQMLQWKEEEDEQSVPEREEQSEEQQELQEQQQKQEQEQQEQSFDSTTCSDASAERLEAEVLEESTSTPPLPAASDIDHAAVISPSAATEEAPLESSSCTAHYATKSDEATQLVPPLQPLPSSQPTTAGHRVAQHECSSRNAGNAVCTSKPPLPQTQPQCGSSWTRKLQLKPTRAQVMPIAAPTAAPLRPPMKRPAEAELKASVSHVATAAPTPHALHSNSCTSKSNTACTSCQSLSAEVLELRARVSALEAAAATAAAEKSAQTHSAQQPLPILTVEQQQQQQRQQLQQVHAQRRDLGNQLARARSELRQEFDRRARVAEQRVEEMQGQIHLMLQMMMLTQGGGGAATGTAAATGDAGGEAKAVPSGMQQAQQQQEQHHVSEDSSARRLCWDDEALPPLLLAQDTAHGGSDGDGSASPALLPSFLLHECGAAAGCVHTHSSPHHHHHHAWTTEEGWVEPYAHGHWHRAPAPFHA